MITNKKLYFLLCSVAVVFLLTAQFALAAEEAEGGSSIGVVLQLITLIIIGGTLFNLWLSSTGFGGQIGAAIKTISGGIVFLSLEVLDEVIETLTGFGSENIFGEGLLHNVAHSLVVLLGFVLLSIGMAQIAKLVKTMKG